MMMISVDIKADTHCSIKTSAHLWPSSLNIAMKSSYNSKFLLHEEGELVEFNTVQYENILIFLVGIKLFPTKEVKSEDLNYIPADFRQFPTAQKGVGRAIVVLFIKYGEHYSTNAIHVSSVGARGSQHGKKCVTKLKTSKLIPSYSM